MRISDWSSDVCSSDLRHLNAIGLLETLERAATERRLRLLQVQASAEIARTAILGGCLSAARKAETSLRTMAGHSGSWGPKRGALILLDAASGLAQIAAWKHEWDEALQWIGEAQRSEEHTSELQSLMRISSAVFCL